MNEVTVSQTDHKALIWAATDLMETIDRTFYEAAQLEQVTNALTSIPKVFPNGFTSWQETHFEVVSAIAGELLIGYATGVVADRYNAQGTGGMYELAEELTDKFERDCPTELFNDMDFFETIESFLETELKISGR